MEKITVRTIEDIERVFDMATSGAVTHVTYEGIRFEQYVPEGIDTIRRADGIKAVTRFFRRAYALIRYGNPRARLRKVDRERLKVDFVEDGDRSRFIYDASRALNYLQEAAEQAGADFKGRHDNLFGRLAKAALSLAVKEKCEDDLTGRLSETYLEAFEKVPPQHRGATLVATVAALAFCLGGSGLPRLMVDAFSKMLNPPGQTVLSDLEETVIVKNNQGTPVADEVKMALTKVADAEVTRARKILVTKGPQGVLVRYAIDEYQAVMPAMLDMAADTEIVMNGVAFDAKAMKRLGSKARREAKAWKTTITMS